MEWLARLLISVASLVLPRERRQRYALEWAAEYRTIVADHGAFSGLTYTLGIVSGAPRTGSTLRNGDDLPFAEAAFACLAFAIPSLFFVAHGLLTGQPLLTVVHLMIFVGLVVSVVAMSGQRDGIFDSTGSRLGLLLTFVAATVLTYLNRFTDVMNPALDGPFRVLPGSMLAQAGMIMMLTAGWFRTRRIQMLRAGLMVSVAGLTVWLGLSFLNVVLVEEWTDRAFHFITMPSLLAVIYACWSASKRYLTVELGPSPNPAA